VPSFFDWVAVLRHDPHGTRIPWLERHASQDLEAIPASVLALHLPSAGGSGLGNLVIAPDGDSAFITEQGTCWEIGNLQAAIKEVHQSSDGQLQIFLARPTSLHVTIEPASAPAAITVLGLSSNSTRQKALGDEMGLFSKKSATAPPSLAFPVGQDPPLGIPLNEYLVKRAMNFTSKSAIPHEDLMAYSDAAYAHVLGVPENDLIIAWGPALIQSPEDAKARQGTVVVTRQTLLAYWQPSRTSLIHTFQGNHSAVTDTQQDSEYSMRIHWEIAEYANNKGKFYVGEAPMILGAQLGRDGHANRRALTWYFTLAALLDGGGTKNGNSSPPSSSGGLGSSGTKL
jgi:hypothetical protein